MTITCGDVTQVLPTLPDGCVQCCITSPPYWGLRDYGVEGQLGLEPTPEEYVEKMVAVFREVRRVLRDDGTLWLVLGDSYAFGIKGSGGPSDKQLSNAGSFYNASQRLNHGLKPKDLVGIPWRVAFALQADGWYLRSDIIWCLIGGTTVYAKTQKGAMPMMVKDLAPLDPSTEQRLNGEKWTQLLGISKSGRKGDEMELVLRSGERISCTPTHRFPTNRGLLSAGDIRIGDVIESTTLPEPDAPKDCAIDADAAWFAGLYVAEGSRAGDTIQIAGHVKERERWRRVQAIAAKYGGTATLTEVGNSQHIRVYGKVLSAIIDELVTGKTAHTKGFAPVVWRYSNLFISAMVAGYLSGDAHKDGNRYRLGFCRNYNLERDLRTACARLGYTLTLNMAHVPYNGRKVPTFRGELRMEVGGYGNEKDRAEVVAIRKSRCRNVYDIGVADEPHLFALASGVLTHNSKPNPMPESVTDRPTKSHEYVFLLTKQPRYYYDAEAVREPHAEIDRRTAQGLSRIPYNGKSNPETREFSGGADWLGQHPNGRNRRSVWTIATEAYPEAHFATFPTALVKPCVLAGTSERGVCPACGKPWERVTETQYKRHENWFGDKQGARHSRGAAGHGYNEPIGTTTTGWRAGCDCDACEPVPATVLDPFCGSGTTGLVALTYGRDFIGIDLSPEYLAMAERRIAPAAAQEVLAL